MRWRDERGRRRVSVCERKELKQWQSAKRELALPKEISAFPSHQPLPTSHYQPATTHSHNAIG